MLVFGLLMGAPAGGGAAGDWVAKAEVLHHFSGLNGDGSDPRGQLIEGQDGFLYGATCAGGRAGMGTLYRIRTNGNDFLVFHHFIHHLTALADEGRNPAGGIIMGRDGALYGTTADWSGSLYGTIFRCNPDGEDYRVIKKIRRNTPTALLDPPLKFLEAGLVQDAEGSLYGCATGGGANGYGAVFTITTNGTGFKRLHDFFGGAGDGSTAQAALFRSANGRLYGTTAGGGRFNRGTVFAMDPDGRNYAVLHHFGNRQANDGAAPAGPLLEREDGFLYGTTRNGGGGFEQGVVFRVRTNGENFRVICSFNTTIGETSGTPGECLVEVGKELLMTTLSSRHPLLPSSLILFDPEGKSVRVIHLEGFGGLPHPMRATTPPFRGRDGAYFGATVTGGRFVGGTVYRMTLEKKAE